MMNRSIYRLGVSAAALLAALPLAAPAQDAPAPMVTVDEGRAAGVALPGGGAKFLDLPYAAPPIGPLRWQAPQPAPRWTGVRQATAFGATCMQPDQGYNKAAAARSSEDCLQLNVWTPNLRKGAALPVMLWIHGGGFSGGAGADTGFDGQTLAAHGVVVVTINYRLGVFGFFSHPALEGELAGNFGLADQIAALRWVRANIAQFGGDPAKVTIFGQSAGGGSVIDMMASPLARGLFRGAIVESGAALRAIVARSLADGQATGERFAAGKSIEQMRAIPAAELLAMANPPRPMPGNPGGPVGGAGDGPPPIAFGPIVDGTLLTEDAMQTFARHGEAHVPLIIGNNSREALGRLDDAHLPDALKAAYGERAAQAAALYLAGAPDPVLGTPANQWLTDSGFRCGSVITALRHASTGAPTWEYQFEQSLPGQAAIGAQHTFELPFVFGNLGEGGLFGPAGFGADDRALSAVMTTYWTNFAKTLDPNDGGPATWPRFDATRRGYVRFAEALPGDQKAAEGLRRAQCDLYATTLTR